MLSAKEVQHIAKLARIGLTDEEILRFQKDLGSILEYVDILREIDNSSIIPRTATLPLQNIVRQDNASAKDAQKGQHLLQMAPATKDGYLKVKSIL